MLHTYVLILKGILKWQIDHAWAPIQQQTNNITSKWTLCEVLYGRRWCTLLFLSDFAGIQAASMYMLEGMLLKIKIVQSQRKAAYVV